MPYVLCDGEARPRSIDIFVIDLTEREMAVATTESIPTRAGQLPLGDCPTDGMEHVRKVAPSCAVPYQAVRPDHVVRDRDVGHGAIDDPGVRKLQNGPQLPEGPRRSTW